MVVVVVVGCFGACPCVWWPGAAGRPPSSLAGMWRRRAPLASLVRVGLGRGSYLLNKGLLELEAAGIWVLPFGPAMVAGDGEHLMMAALYSSSCLPLLPRVGDLLVLPLPAGRGGEGRRDASGVATAGGRGNGFCLLTHLRGGRRPRWVILGDLQRRKTPVMLLHANPSNKRLSGARASLDVRCFSLFLLAGRGGEGEVAGSSGRKAWLGRSWEFWYFPFDGFLPASPTIFARLHPPVAGVSCWSVGCSTSTELARFLPSGITRAWKRHRRALS